MPQGNLGDSCWETTSQPAQGALEPGLTVGHPSSTLWMDPTTSARLHLQSVRLLASTSSPSILENGERGRRNKS